MLYGLLVKWRNYLVRRHGPLKVCVCMYLPMINDLIIFKFFRVILSFKKKTIQFPLSFNLYFQQKLAPKLSIYHLLTKRSACVFDVTNRTNGYSNFQSYRQVVMYLFYSLAKSCTLFWKYSETINRNNIFELTYYK